ncbi:succinate dehydrogenase cytochrome b subunit [Gemmatimonas sp.]|jgi:succinate dehydrogenase / fumarate reductase cytochrome b subunit|uniref:succinate dehydrogenase cytochrome b subunit n=1 Tax=Gemmatimonas sp. TaxID=1962908 RepID=UPI0031BC96A5|nr:succinate dehydrogenase cytochrome b subunit [Gemmatimonas sp.]
MYALSRFWQSTVGKKIVMAVTGIIGILFVIGHMAGNLQMFYPDAPAAMKHYAELLRTSMPLLWAIRIGLLTAVVLHAVAAYQLTMLSKAARPEAYAVRRPQVTTLAARTIRWGGVLLLAFIVFHLLHLTIGAVHPQFTHLDPYNNVRLGLANPLVAGFYVLAMLALGLHLYHGSWAVVRTLGVAQPSTQPLKRKLALVLAIVVAGGFIVVPVAAVLGLFPDAPAQVDDATVTSTAAAETH